MNRLIGCAFIFLCCTASYADVLSVYSSSWNVAHGDEGAFSIVSLNGATPHGLLDAGVLQFDQSIDFDTTSTTGQAQLTDDLTNDAANSIVFHYGSQSATVSELSLVNQVPPLSSFDFAGYDISGYHVKLNSLVSGPSGDIVGFQITILGDPGTGSGLPEPATMLYVAIGAVSLFSGRHRRSNG